ncbi:LysR substrate-binding domain-containing protein [Mesorhizobium sp. UC74_2]|uniref:LysR substrate-binding domain-containing protein n=1 Tax=Mesorhizobium sp. UC74_2 TaxID=3350171 RepID=UPI00366B204A
MRFDHRLSISTTSAVRTAVMAGGGLAVLPDYQVAEDVALGRLIHVLPDWALPTGGIYAVFPQKRHRSRKVELFLDVIRTRLRYPGDQGSGCRRPMSLGAAGSPRRVAERSGHA